jgi:hypothetical protein
VTDRALILTATRATCRADLLRRDIMRKFKYGLVALAASAAMIIPAGAANASTQSASTAMNPPGQCGVIVVLCVDVLHNGVNIWTGDIASPDISNVCILNDVDVLNKLKDGLTLTCSNGNKIHKH